MNSFKDFNIKPILTNFTGDKIKIERILNREIIVHQYKIEASKYEKGNGKCLHLQIEINGQKNIVFTGSTVLMDLLERLPKTAFPFKATIVKENEHYEFT